MANTILANDSDKCFGLTRYTIFRGTCCKKTRILQDGNDKGKKKRATKAEASKK